jgi:hypothetical protein
LERSFSPQKLKKFQNQYCIKLPSKDKNDKNEVGLMVIKRVPKTKAFQKTTCIRNWKKFCKSIMKQLKEQNLKAPQLLEMWENKDVKVAKAKKVKKDFNWSTYDKKDQKQLNKPEIAKLKLMQEKNQQKAIEKSQPQKKQNETISTLGSLVLGSKTQPVAKVEPTKIEEAKQEPKVETTKVEKEPAPKFSINSTDSAAPKPKNSLKEKDEAKELPATVVRVKAATEEAVKSVDETKIITEKEKIEFKPEPKAETKAEMRSELISDQNSVDESASSSRTNSGGLQQTSMLPPAGANPSLTRNIKKKTFYPNQTSKIYPMMSTSFSSVNSQSVEEPKMSISPLKEGTKLDLSDIKRPVSSTQKAGSGNYMKQDTYPKFPQQQAQQKNYFSLQVLDNKSSDENASIDSDKAFKQRTSPDGDESKESKEEQPQQAQNEPKF